VAGVQVGMTERLYSKPLGYWPDHLAPPLTITAVEGLWRSRRGYLMHRPRSGRIYIHNRHMSLAWWCGNSTNEPIRVKAECMDGLKACRRCEAMYAGEAG